jgi:hypothetical protein
MKNPEKNKKCNHLEEALKYYKEDLKAEKENEGRRLSQRIDTFSRLMRYSSIQILYETEKGRIVTCYLCDKIWYTQAEYSKHLRMQT